MSHGSKPSTLAANFPTVKKVIFILLILGGLAAIIWLTRNNESNTLSPPFPAYSKTIDESKENGIFEFELALYKSNLTLDKGLELRIKDAWLENAWNKRALLIGKTWIQKRNGHQIVLNLEIIEDPKQRTNKLNFFLGNVQIRNYVHYNCDRIDTIKVPLYKQASFRLPSRKDRKAFDSLIFIKRQISS